MKRLLIFLVIIVGSVLCVAIVTSLEIERPEIIWLFISVFIVAFVRLLYFDRKLFVIRIIAIIVFGLLVYGLTSQLNLGSNWITKRVIYRNKQLAGRAVEIQSKTTGEWPKWRTVDRISLLPFVYWKEMDSISLTHLDTLRWEAVH